MCIFPADLDPIINLQCYSDLFLTTLCRPKQVRNTKQQVISFTDPCKSLN